MRLILVDNLVLPHERDLHLLDTHPHLGLLSLAAVAGAAGHQTTIYDPKRLIRNGALPYDEHLYERVAAALLAGSPDAVGFTTLGCSFLFVLGVGRELARTAPDLPLLLGGPHATMLARPILERYEPFDVVVRHEAEQTLPGVLDGLERRDFRDVPGVTWRTATGVQETQGSPRVDDLDALPWLDYDLYPMHELGLELLRVEAGRGCPFSCTFCSTATFFQRRYRLKSPPRLVAEMDRLADRYGPREFKLDHDLFTVDRRRVRAFCDAVRGHGHCWRVSARVDCVDDELLVDMADAGCVGLYFGVETGSPRMQKVVAKRLKLALVEPRLGTCARLGIEATASFITGYPEETYPDQDATLDMVGRCLLRPEGTCLTQLHILTPEPGTPLFDQLSGSLAFDGYATPFNAWLLRPEDLQALRGDSELFATYYHYPTALPRAEHIGVVEAVDLLRGLNLTLLAALVDRHPLGFPGLVRDLVAEAADPPVPTLADLETYARRTRGDDDPVTSVLRYLRFTAESSAPAPSPSEPVPCGGVPRSHSRYRLPAGTRILHDVHDVAEVAAWLGDSDADRAATLPRASYVRLPGVVDTLAVDPGVATLLQLFGSGRSVPELAEQLSPAVGDVQADRWLPPLLDQGLLVVAEDGPTVDAR